MQGARKRSPKLKAVLQEVNQGSFDGKALSLQPFFCLIWRFMSMYRLRKVWRNQTTNVRLVAGRSKSTLSFGNDHLTLKSTIPTVGASTTSLKPVHCDANRHALTSRVSITAILFIMPSRRCSASAPLCSTPPVSVPYH